MRTIARNIVIPLVPSFGGSEERDLFFVSPSKIVWNSASLEPTNVN